MDLILDRAEDRRLEGEIKAFIEALCADLTKHDKAKLDEHWATFYADEKVQVLRPSGNAMSKITWAGMLKSDGGSDDSVNEFGKLVSIDSVRIFAGGIGAVATYTKRAANDNLAVYSATLEKKDGAWKVVFGTATGQPPTDQA